MEDGRQKRLSFTPQTLGGSVYFSRDEVEQRAIESHPWFGDKVFLREAIDEEKMAEEARKKEEQNTKKAESDIVTHKVTSLSDAKDYLAERFGISRSRLRTKAAIMSSAKEHGVILEGLD